MERDRIESLLRQADQAAGPPPDMPGDLAERVRRLARQRQHVRVFRGALAACVASALIGALFVHHLGKTRTGHESIARAAPSVQEQLREISEATKRLRRELAAIAVAIPPAKDALELAELEPSPASGINQQLERAAYLAVYQGDRYYRELGMPESALTSYRETIRLFPQTRAAQMARARLAELKNEKGKAL